MASIMASIMASLVCTVAIASSVSTVGVGGLVAMASTMASLVCTVASAIASRVSTVGAGGLVAMASLVCTVASAIASRVSTVGAGGLVAMASLVCTVASAIASLVSTVAAFVPLASGLFIAISVFGVVSVVVLGPLVVISPDFASVLLIVVGLGSDGVVRLAPSRVEVGSVGLLGPLIVVVARLGSSVIFRGLFIMLAVFATVTIAVSVGSLLVIRRRGGLTVGGGTVEISVFTPGLSAVLVIVFVVPFVVGLSVVGFGPGSVVGFFDAQILVTSPGIPVGATLAAVACSVSF